jgi:putative nucleotidyltransferase with HDIG domain
MIMDRKQAWALLNEYVSNPALIRHGLAVEAAMRYYARLQDADEELWGVTGLLHDFDYERHPDPPEHTRAGAKILRQQGAGEALIGAILSHAEWNLDEYPRDTPLRKTLFAVDELCGFIVACALVRPARLAGMTAKSVRKKMKQASFAAAVNRADIATGAELLGLDLNTHIDHCIAALTPHADTLDLAEPEAT